MGFLMINLVLACTMMFASIYWDGTRTANGEKFNPSGFTAAHRTLPFGTKLRVHYRGKSVDIRINDRGPARWTGNDLDLSLGSAMELGLTKKKGQDWVCVEKINANSG